MMAAVQKEGRREEERRKAEEERRKSLGLCKTFKSMPQ